MASDELWHLVEARRDDGTPTMFRIRELEPRLEQPRIFVVELPYPATALSRLPDAAAYRRLSMFEEQWVGPACATLGWTFVAAKTEDGSFFLYLYGSSDPNALIEKLSPFDGALGFFDEHDPTWDEYAALRELLDEANAMPPEVTREPEPATTPSALDEGWTDDRPVTRDSSTKIQPLPRAPTAAGSHPPAARPAVAKRAATPAAKHAAKPAVAKRAAKRAVAKRAAKRAVAKRAARPAAKRAVAKRAARPAAAKRAAKPVVKPAAKPAAASPAAKRAAAKPAAGPKPAAKRAAAKRVAKRVARPAARPAAAKATNAATAKYTKRTKRT